MRLLPEQDDLDLAASLRALLAAECPPSVIRGLRDNPDDKIPDRLWTALANAGVFGLALPTEYGGAGGKLSALGVFYVEAGRALCPTIVHSTVQAALAIDMLGADEHRAAWLPGLAAGTTRATTSLFSARDAADIEPELSARSEADGGWRLRGSADFVLDADFADLLVVSAADDDEQIMGFVVDTHAEGVHAMRLPVMGGYRTFRVDFDGVRVTDPWAVLTGPHGNGLLDDALHRVANTAVALLSLDLVGVGEAVLQRTVEYTKARKQFGRPIASFQAAQHLVANMHIALAAARLAGHSAMYWMDDDNGDPTWETAIARMQAASAAKLITLDAHQLHGGMGYVVETDLHLFSERARVLSTLGGGADIAATWLMSESPHRMFLTEDNGW
jgi:alkylation response protein AidB-like acyl-CoA dehydrogenase